jgi:hypothetical protein
MDKYKVENFFCAGNCKNYDTVMRFLGKIGDNHIIQVKTYLLNIVIVASPDTQLV